MTNFKNLRAWCLTDGSAGMISQVKGLADALNLNFEQKTIDLKFPWNKLPVGILPPSKIIFNNYRQISLESNIPPDIIISCGKRSIYASLHLKKSLKNKVFSIHIQNPKINPAHFDLVVAPAHDDLKGKNVLQTDLALNHINKNLLNKEAFPREIASSCKSSSCNSSKGDLRILASCKSSSGDRQTSTSASRS